MHKTNIKAVLFDLDDTLWAIAPVLHRAENLLYEWLREHAPGLVLRHTSDSLRLRRLALAQSDPNYNINLWALRHAVLTQALAESGEDPALADQAMTVFSTARNAITPFADVIPALQRLQPHFKVGAVSNGVADLAQIGLSDHFQIAIAAHQFGAAKPDPAIFHAACRALAVAPEHAVYVGDDLTLDVLGAQQAGLRAVWMNRCARDLPDHVQPDAVCADLTELMAWLSVTSPNREEAGRLSPCSLE